MKNVQIVMPSDGDMTLVEQNKEKGTITLQPIYFGGECAGPIIRFIDGDNVEASYRIKLRKDGEPKLVKADA